MHGGCMDRQPTRKWASVGKLIAAHEFCLWLPGLFMNRRDGRVEPLFASNDSEPLVFCPPACVAAMLESSHITHILRIMCIRRLAREQRQGVLSYVCNEFF